MIVADQSEVTAFLEQTASYDRHYPDREPGDVTRIDTHGAVVFLVGNYAFKMKRAVYFEYMDFSTLERRQKCCEAEITHNQRTSPEIYRTVVAVVRGHDGELALGGEGEVVEWLVEMRRFDEDKVFDRLALRGELSADLISETADMICDFFEQISVHREPDACDTIPDIVSETVRQLAEGVPDVFSQDRADALTSRQSQACGKLAHLLEGRRKGGFVRLGHGDLHLRNICLVDGRPLLFDAIEFNDRLAISDILYDLAFLLMDLLHRGRKDHANLVLNCYLERTSDDAGVELLPLYLSVRAGIRAFTAIPAAASQSDPVIATRVRKSAAEYLDIASGFLANQMPRLVGIGGLSGSGKSTLARSLAPRMAEAAGAVVLRSDVIRKNIFGKRPTETLGPEGYTPEITQQVYAQLTARTTIILKAGQSVIVDAVHARQSERISLEEVAESAGVSFTGIWLEALRDLMARRIDDRQNDASDATTDVLDAQLGYDPGNISWAIIDGSGACEDITARAEALITA
jgi:uncharacterized protein